MMPDEILERISQFPSVITRSKDILEYNEAQCSRVEMSVHAGSRKRF